MFKKLLVPIDGSHVSDGLIGRAVVYAKSVGAKIAFFHACPDYASTGDGALAHTAWPKEFQELANGKTLWILAKAEAAARAAGVACHAASTVSDRPDEAIHRAAVDHGCDLIFMASRGSRGALRILHRSVSAKLLEITTLPVLVSTVEANQPQTDEESAQLIIRDEHRSLAAVLHAMRQLVRQATATRAVPDARLLRAMLFYVEAFPNRLHHPKEDAYLFARLRERAPECGALIDELQRDHQNGSQRVRSLRDSIERLSAPPPGDPEQFEQLVEVFVAGQLRHMTLEEEILLPLAHGHLTSSDWQEIKQAFHDNADPRFGVDADKPFDRLLARLMSMVDHELHGVVRSPN